MRGKAFCSISGICDVSAKALSASQKRQPRAGTALLPRYRRRLLHLRKDVVMAGIARRASGRVASGAQSHACPRIAESIEDDAVRIMRNRAVSRHQLVKVPSSRIAPRCNVEVHGMADQGRSGAIVQFIYRGRAHWILSAAGTASQVIGAETVLRWMRRPRSGHVWRRFTVPRFVVPHAQPSFYVRSASRWWYLRHGAAPDYDRNGTCETDSSNSSHYLSPRCVNESSCDKVTMALTLMDRLTHHFDSRHGRCDTARAAILPGLGYGLDRAASRWLD